MIVEFEDLPSCDNKTYNFDFISKNDGVYQPVTSPEVRLVRFKAERKFLFFRTTGNGTADISNIPKKHYWHDQLFTKVNTKITVR